MSDVYSQGNTPIGAFTNGSATYVGYVTHSIGGIPGVGGIPTTDPTETVIGELAVSADFNSNDISVSLYNLVSDVRGGMPGEISGAGQIDYIVAVDAASFDFGVEGSLTIDGVPAEYVGTLGGTFYGDSPDLVFVDIDGTAFFVSDPPEDFDFVGYGLVE